MPAPSLEHFGERPYNPECLPSAIARRWWRSRRRCPIRSHLKSLSHPWGAVQVSVIDEAAHERVHDLIRFGWISAELRGRYRQRLVGLPLHAPEIRPQRTEHTPPLNYERSAGELDHQIKRAAVDLATLLQFNPPAVDLPYQPATASGTATDTLSALCVAAEAAQADEDKQSAWNHLANFFYGWDTYIQDAIVSGSSMDSAAYQVGRGLSEAYWALDPDVPADDVRHWKSLLGVGRRAALKRFLLQVAPFYDPLTISGISTSLEAWGRVIDSTQSNLSSNATDELRSQTAIWRVLLVDQINPLSFVDSKTALRYAGGIKRLLRVFLPELTAAIVIIAVTILVVLVFPTTTSPGVRTAIVAVAGILGVTSASLLAVVKAIANASIAKLRSALNAEMVADAVAVIPAKK